jgi:hypothetical protein
MTATASIEVAFRRVIDAAIRAAREQDVVWWGPADGTDVVIEDGWVIANIAGHELCRVRQAALIEIANNIQRQTN